jgi:hypothetical protein
MQVFSAHHIIVIFGVFCLVMTIHVFFLYPETAGKSLEEMDEIFASKIPAWRTKTVKGFDQKVQDRVADKTDVEPGVVQAEGIAAEEKRAGAEAADRV